MSEAIEDGLFLDAIHVWTRRRSMRISTTSRWSGSGIRKRCCRSRSPSGWTMVRCGSFEAIGCGTTMRAGLARGGSAITPT